MKIARKIIADFCTFAICLSAIFPSMVVHTDSTDGTDSIFDEDEVLDDLTEWLFGARTFRDAISDLITAY